MNAPKRARRSTSRIAEQSMAESLGRSILLWLVGLLPIVVGLMAWEFASTADSLSFPEPSSWWDAGYEMWDDGILAPAFKTTLTTFLVSLTIASAAGVGLGMLIGFNPRLDRALTPLMDIFRTLPPPVMVPVLTLLLGITLTASVTIVVLAVIWPVTMNTVNAVREIPVIRREIAPVLGLGRVEAFWKISLPSVTVGAVVGVRTALSLALVVTLLVDIIGSADGLGRLLVKQQQFFEASAVWALLFLIGVVGYAFSLGIQGVSRFLLRDHPPLSAA